jgi:hypothetical protein
MAVSFALLVAQKPGNLQPRIARRRAEEEQADMLFVCERRRSRRIVERDPRGAERSNQTLPAL